jgi:hypothetical protein
MSLSKFMFRNLISNVIVVESESFRRYISHGDEVQVNDIKAFIKETSHSGWSLIFLLSTM